MKSESNNKKQTMTVCIAIGLVAGGVLSASAQQQQQDRGAERPAVGQQEQTEAQQPRQPDQRPSARTDARQPGMQQGGATRQEHAMKRASKLMDMEVHGRDGQKLGDVEEIILSQDRRSVEHIKVSLDDGDSVKISLDDLSAKTDDDNVLQVRASKQELQQRQTMDRAQARVRGDREQDEQASRQVSKLIGLDVQGTDGKDVGSIDDLIIDTQSGRIEIAAVKTGGLLGLRTRLASVEWQQVNFAADGDTASINMTKDTLSKRAHTQSEYWDRHAFEGVEDQRERAPGMEGRQPTDPQQPDQTERAPGMEGRQPTAPQQTGQPEGEVRIQGQD